MVRCLEHCLAPGPERGGEGRDVFESSGLEVMSWSPERKREGDSGEEGDLCSLWCLGLWVVVAVGMMGSEGGGGMGRKTMQG